MRLITPRCSGPRLATLALRPLTPAVGPTKSTPCGEADDLSVVYAPCKDAVVVGRRRLVRPRGTALTATMALLLLVTPFAAEAQQAVKTHRIAILANEPSSAIEGLRHGLRDLGYLEGRDVTFDYAWAGTRSERFAELAADVVRRKADFIITWGTPAALAAKKATATIPIVMGAIGDPISVGVVTSLARPGGNITGLSSLAVELEAKRLELLKALAPHIFRVAVLWHANNPALAVSSKTAIEAAHKLHVKLLFVSVTEAPTLDAVLERVRRLSPDALLVMAEPSLIAQGANLAAFAVRNRLPAVYAYPEHAQAGGLLTYATSYYDLFRRAASYVDRILKGAKPGDLPIEQPTKFELIVNARTAKSLGLTIPPSLLLRADTVIE
jgi:putative ABC transport system substrate-binding protein